MLSVSLMIRGLGAGDTWIRGWFILLLWAGVDNQNIVTGIDYCLSALSLSFFVYRKRDVCVCVYKTLNRRQTLKVESCVYVYFILLSFF